MTQWSTSSEIYLFLGNTYWVDEDECMYTQPVIVSGSSQVIM